MSTSKDQLKTHDKSIKLEGKYGADAYNSKAKPAVGANSAAIASASKNQAKLKAEGGNVSKSRLGYNPLENTNLDSPELPYFLFIPNKRDLQVMIKKAVTVQNADEIVINM